MVKVKLFLIAGLCLVMAKAQGLEGTRVIREYVAYTYPVDVRKTYLIPDWIVAGAISSGLVRTGEDSGLASDLADRWSFNSNERYIEFHVHPGARWSDGNLITAKEIVESFNQARSAGRNALPSAFKSFSEFEAVNTSIVRLHLAPGVEAKPDIISQLEDPTCAVVKIVNGKQSTRVTSGAFYIESASEKEIVMKVNRFWNRYSSDMIDEIHLRRPTSGISAETLLHDPWPNVVRFGYGILKSDLATLPAGIAKHQLNLNRVIGLHYGGRTDLTRTRKLIGFLRGQIDSKSFSEQLDDSKPAAQFSPPGVAFHLTQDPPLKTVSSGELLRTWKKPTVRIAFYQDNMPAGIVNLMQNELKRVLPLPLEFIGVPASAKIRAEHTKEFDLIYGTLGADVSDLAGSMSYYIETEPAHFPSDKTGKFNFKARLEAVRRSKENQIEGYRTILNDVVENNFYLPIAFYSSEVVGRPGIDFSHISKFGDLMPYPAVRMRQAQ